MNSGKSVSIFQQSRSPESYVYKKSNLILWAGKGKKIPPPPDPSVPCTEYDDAYWYDLEYGCLNVEKKPPLPSPGNGPKGKRVICIKAESDAYQKECEISMVRMAEALGMHLTIEVSGWDAEKQEQLFAETIAKHPDMIINIPGKMSRSTEWYASAYAQRIPIISATLCPANDALQYVVAWCGHDAWMESRMLARQFAELMQYQGSFCIIEHMPDTSAFYSRTYGALTELTKIAPRMHLLAMETSYLRADLTESLVLKWLEEYGADISGIVCPNDIAVLRGLNKALAARNRTDIIRVSNGTTREGLQSLKAGTVEALTFKSPAIDGGLPVQIAADWFNGLLVDPIRFLPTHIITRSDVDDFLNRRDYLEEIDLSPLAEAVDQQNLTLVDRFFDSIYLTFVYTKVISLELFRGFTIELFSQLINITNSYSIAPERIVGSYESVFKNLFNQPSLEATLEWMRSTAKRIVEELRQRNSFSKIQQVIHHINRNIHKPLSLKELSFEFGVSPRYLGKLFREETGKAFNDYINDERIAKAQTYLRNTSMSAAEIAREVGYSDPNYFYKQFRQTTGLSVTEFRTI